MFYPPPASPLVPPPPPAYLPFTLPPSAVHTVDTTEGLGLLLAHFLECSPRVMGIDAEWSCAPRCAVSGEW